MTFNVFKDFKYFFNTNGKTFMQVTVILQPLVWDKVSTNGPK